MKKFLKDNTFEVQTIDVKKLKDIFGELLNPKMLDSENLSKSNKYVVVKNVSNGDYNYQIVIQNIPVIGNHYYTIFVFDKQDNYLGLRVIQANSVFPPLYEKVFGIDYFDFLSIQKDMNKFFIEKFNTKFEIDDSYEGKYVYMSPDENAYEKYLKGERYELIVIFAEKFAEKYLDNK